MSALGQKQTFGDTLSNVRYWGSSGPKQREGGPPAEARVRFAFGRKGPFLWASDQRVIPKSPWMASTSEASSEAGPLAHVFGAASAGAACHGSPH